MAPVRPLMKISFCERNSCRSFLRSCVTHIALFWCSLKDSATVNQSYYGESIREVMKVSGMNPSSEGTEKYAILNTLF